MICTFFGQGCPKTYPHTIRAITNTINIDTRIASIMQATNDSFHDGTNEHGDGANEHGKSSNDHNRRKGERSKNRTKSRIKSGQRHGTSPGPHHNRPINPNPITYQQMVEGVVDQGVGSKYVNEILLLMDWAFANQKDWLCEDVLAAYPTVNTQTTGESYKQFRKRVKNHYTMLLRNAKNVPVFAVDKVTVQRFMEYLASQAHYLTGRVLKSGSYGTKRSAFRHMFRLHNGRGFSAEFENELALAWRGFMRTMAKNNEQKAHQQHKKSTDAGDDDDDNSVSTNNDDDDDRDEFKEGKDPMSPELFRCICRWAIERGTLEGVFLACFLVWTWNLCCRGHNTARVRFSHMTSAGLSDALGVFFRHTKTDQTGTDSKKHQQNIYSKESF